MNQNLPFARGTTQSAPGLEGQTYWDAGRKQHLRICKNTDAAALTGKRIVKMEDASVDEVDYTTAAADGPQVVGVVDPVLSATVPVNKHFYVVTGGVVTVSVGTDSAVIAAKGLIIPAADTDKGKVQALSAIAGAVGLLTSEMNERTYAIGVAQLSANINTDTEIFLYHRWG